jgi:plastocyanin
VPTLDAQHKTFEEETAMKYCKLLPVILMLALALALVGCSSGSATTPTTTGSSTGGSSSAGATVVEKGFAFDPATLEVKVGDTVTFKNEDSAPHNVKIDGKELGTQDQGASVTWTASAAGSFPYTCTIHPSMAGEIVVK